MRDGLGAGGTRRHRRDDTRAGADLQAHHRGGTVGHAHLHGEGRNLANTMLIHGVVGFDDALAAAKPGTDDDTKAVLVDVIRRAGVLPHLTAYVQRHPLHVGHPAKFQPGHVVIDGLLEVPTDPHWQSELLDEFVLENLDTALPGDQSLPRALDVRRDRCRCGESRHNDVGEATVGSGRECHLSEPSSCARMLAAASGFSCSSFSM
ncbi:Uncharacterised protein [Mycobacteroides abscessus subsp. massiliense]|nr:Uncharacterised protein [Mycobacteroides abscessus subsp. massiliense]